MKILQLSTYPIVNPLHGGQIRVSQIRKYLEAKGHHVKSISLSETSHGFYSKDDFLMSEQELTKSVKTPLCTDYATAVLSSEGKPFEFLQKHIHSFMPDVIFLEQPWLWPAIKKMIANHELPSHIRIIYSSQNVEYQTKKKLLESHKIPNPQIDDTLEYIFQLEQDVCIHAHSVIACTKEDAFSFQALGARDSIVCNNGIAPKANDEAISKKLLEDLNGRKYALFVGSAYPPNALGFWEMLGHSLAWLPPEYIIIVAGGVSTLLESYMPKEAKLFAHVSLDRLKRVGLVTEELLSALISNASVILLPITVGGGSNLKTAEAIASLRPVVATTTACRGFESAKHLSDFYITDNQKEFCHATLSYLCNLSQVALTKEEMLVRKSVYWEETLKEVEKSFFLPQEI